MPQIVGTEVTPISNHYHFVSDWRLPGNVQEVFDILVRAEDLPRWWPAAFREVLVIDPGDENGIGRILRFTNEDWLPYRLHWHARTESIDAPNSFSFRVWGDLEGRGTWFISQDGAFVGVRYVWDVRGQKPVLRYFSSLLRPLFVANHNWLMRKGEHSLRLELARRAVKDEPQAAALLQPPPPLRPPWLGIAAAAVISLVALRRLRAK